VLPGPDKIVKSNIHKHTHNSVPKLTSSLAQDDSSGLSNTRADNKLFKSKSIQNLESALDHTDDSLDRRELSGLEKSRSGGPDDRFTTTESADGFDNSVRGLGSGYHHTPKSADEFE
jgi:hypothetical protein